MKTLSHLPWNMVTKNFHAHLQLQQKLLEKIRKLKRHLLHFPTGSVHLQVILEKHAQATRAWFSAALVLRLPSNILRSAKAAADPIPAFDQAIKALLRELASLKADLRREPARKRQGRMVKMGEPVSEGFAA